MPDPFIEADEARGHRDSPLNPAHVNTVFQACLTEPDHQRAVLVQGICHNAAFDRAELADRHGEITAMLEQLPAEFRPHPEGGGGWTFLNLCNDRDGTQWTALHLVMERLIMLGIATDQAEWQFPREMWGVLPGGMPYVQIRPNLS
jgi:hypothetical protein